MPLFDSRVFPHFLPVRVSPGPKGFRLRPLLLALLLSSVSCVSLYRHIPVVNNIDDELASANLHYSREEYPQALEQYDRAIMIRPDCAGCYFGRGLVYIKLQRFDDAIRDFDMAIRYDNEDIWWVYYSRGVAHEKTGNHTRAALDYILVTLNKPDFWNAYMTPRFINAREESFTDCVSAYTGLIRLRPYDKHLAEFRMGAGICYLELGDYENAILFSERALTEKDSLAQAFVTRGMARQKGRGDTEGAEADYSRALELEADNGTALYRRGLLRIRSGERKEEGCADLKRAAELKLPVAEASYRSDCATLTPLLKE